MIVYRPMASGLLTGAFTVERAKSLPKDDWRSSSADFTGDALVATWQSHAPCADRDAARYRRCERGARLGPGLGGRDRRHRRRTAPGPDRRLGYPPPAWS